MAVQPPAHIPGAKAESSAKTNTRLILDALRHGQTAGAWRTCAPDPLDWEDIVVRAIVLGLAPQLHHKLDRWDIDPPPRAAAKLTVTFQAQNRRSEAIVAQLAQVLDACAERGLHPLALKGVHLAADYYPHPALRPMNDIDLLFPVEELTAVAVMLADLGYGGKHKSPELGAGVVKHTSTFRRASGDSSSGSGQDGATPNPYLSAGGDRMIEPHGSLEESWFGLRVDITPGVRERAVTTTIGGRPCHVLCPEDLLLHIAVHFCFHLIQGAPAMLQLTDLLAVTAAPSTKLRAGDAVDWAAFTDRACSRRAAPYALAALTLAVKLLDAPIPTAVLDDLAMATPTPLRRRARRLDLEDILRRTQQKPLGGLLDRLRRGLLDRAETARWAPDWRGRWAVWRTALDPARTDTGRLILGKE